MSDAVEKLRQWITRQPMTAASGGGNHTGLDLFAKAVDELAFRAERAEASLHVRTVEYDEMQRAQEAGAERIRELLSQVQLAESEVKRVTAILESERAENRQNEVDVAKAAQAREAAEKERDEARDGWLRDAELLKRAEAENGRLLASDAEHSRRWSQAQQERSALLGQIREARGEGEEFRFRQATECIAGRGYSATVPLDALAVAREVAAELYRLRDLVEALAAGWQEATGCTGPAEAQEVITRAEARMKVLEAERDAYKRDFEAELAGAASMRMRHGARENETMHGFVARLAAAESRLAAIRQRAETWRSTGRLGDESRAALEFVLETDAPAPSEPKDCATCPERADFETLCCKGGLVSELDGLRGEMAEAHYPPEDGHDTPGCRCVSCSVRAALTGAPPVFTLEEVRAALVAELESPGNCGVSYVDCCAAACDGLVKRLENLRR